MSASTSESLLQISNFSKAFRNVFPDDLLSYLHDLSVPILETAPMTEAQASIDEVVAGGTESEASRSAVVLGRMDALDAIVSAWCDNIKDNTKVAYMPQQASLNTYRDGRDTLLPRRVLHPETEAEQALQDVHLRDGRELVSVFQYLEVKRQVNSVRLQIDGVSDSPEGYQSTDQRPWLALRIFLDPTRHRAHGKVEWAGGKITLAPRYANRVINTYPLIMAFMAAGFYQYTWMWLQRARWDKIQGVESGWTDSDSLDSRKKFVPYFPSAVANSLGILGVFR